jgi:hypothetical protein
MLRPFIDAVDCCACCDSGEIGGEGAVMPSREQNLIRGSRKSVNVF